MQSCHVTGVLGPGSPCGSGFDHTHLPLPPSWESRAAARPVLALWLIVSLGVKGGPGQRLPVVCWWGCVFIESEVTSVQNFPGSLEAWRCPSCPEGVLVEAVGASVVVIAIAAAVVASSLDATIDFNLKTKAHWQPSDFFSYSAFNKK